MTKKVAQAERNVRGVLSSWQFWTLIPYFGLLAVVIALYAQDGRIARAESIAVQEQTTRLAAVHASAEAQYHECLASIPLLTRVDRFVEGVQELHITLVANAEATHGATAPGTAVYDVQGTNLQRLRHSVTLVSGVHFNVPTKASCKARRAKIIATG